MCNEKDCGHFPFKNMQAMMQEMASHFRNRFQRYGNWVPYNLQDCTEYYLILVPLAGRAKEDVKISLIEENLNITAKKPQIFENDIQQDESEEKTMNQTTPFLKNFFTFIEVNMDIPLPIDADRNEIKPKLVNGLLRIKIGKVPPKTINIDNEEPK